MLDETRQLVRGAAMDAQFWSHARLILRQVIPPVHERKEEEVLFPTLVPLGMRDRTGSIGVFRAEHREGNVLIAQLCAAIEQDDPVALETTVRCYATHYLEHLEREDRFLLPNAKQLLAVDHLRKIRRGFDRINDEVERLIPAAQREAALAALRRRRP